MMEMRFTGRNLFIGRELRNPLTVDVPRSFSALITFSSSWSTFCCTTATNL